MGLHDIDLGDDDMTRRIFDVSPRDMPGPGDLDPGPDACLGGACPHDHDDFSYDDEPDVDDTWMFWGD